jgi:asparagine synthase (glutamine-hydrolysing)
MTHFSAMILAGARRRACKTISLRRRAQFDAATLDHDLRSQLPDGFETWGWAGKAQALEIMTFMTPYLLGSQGGRVAMANAVEGRFPFLDHRVIEFANSLPISLKLRTLSQYKYLLRRLASSCLPEVIVNRPKMPYRADPRHRALAPGRLHRRRARAR